VLIGSSNEKFLVVKDGLAREDAVLLNPRVHPAYLPEAQDVAPRAETQIVQTGSTPASTTPASAPSAKGSGL
jgi:hypothetical protein